MARAAWATAGFRECERPQTHHPRANRSRQLRLLCPGRCRFCRRSHRLGRIGGAEVRDWREIHEHVNLWRPQMVGDGDDFREAKTYDTITRDLLGEFISPFTLFSQNHAGSPKEHLEMEPVDSYHMVC
jgi:hypothetical protein